MVLNDPVPRRSGMAAYDHSLLWVVLALLVMGTVMVYSSSTAIAEADPGTRHQAAYFLLRQLGYLLLAATGAFVVFQIPTSLWQKAAPILFVIGVVCLIAVLIPGLGKVVNGSRRWIPLGPLGNFQPSEMVKFLTVIYAADYTVRKAAMMHDLRQGFLPMFGVMVLVGALLLLEPDFGAFVVIVSIALGVLFLGGLNARLFFGLSIMLSISFVLLIISSDYRRERVLGYLDPWKDPYGAGYQLAHSLMAFGRGEWFGAGLGSGVEKLFYLPEAHTDFLLAVIAEELGFVGVLTVIALFAWLVWRAFSIAWQAALMGRNFQALAAQGVGIWMGAQAFINMGVNMGVLPTKGLTLPLMSYGGSGIIANCLAIALLFRIDFENRCLMKGKRQ